MENKYQHLTSSELEDLFDNILNYDQKAKIIFLKEIFEQATKEQVSSLWQRLYYHNGFNDINGDEEKKIYLSFVKRCFSILPNRAITSEDFDEDFIYLISSDKNLLEQYFKLFFDLKLKDKQTFSIFNSMVAEMVSGTEIINDSENFKNIFITYQNHFETAILEEAILMCSKPFDIYSQLNDGNKNKLEKEECLDSILNHCIEKYQKKDNLVQQLKENDLFDKLGINQLIYTLEFKKTFLDSLFSKEKIKESLNENFISVLLKNAHNKDNNFKLIKKHLSETEIIRHLKNEILENKSLGNFYKNYKNHHYELINSLVNIFDSFEEEFKQYFKEKPIKVLQSFFVSQEKQIKSTMKKNYEFTSENYEEKYNNLLSEIEQKLLNETINQDNLKLSKKIKI
jgi:hypothetical protein